MAIRGTVDDTSSRPDRGINPWVKANPLATFVHISDLHIGLPPVAPGPVPSQSASHTGRPSAAFDSIYFLGKLLQTGFWGLMGHHRPAFLQLAQTLAEGDLEIAPLIFTGDLTAYGHEAQFQDGFAYLEGRLIPPGADPSEEPGIGLGRKDWSRLGMPGNHDYFRGWEHWLEAPPLGGQPNSRPREDPFRPMPRVEWERVDSTAAGSLWVRFVILDSDAEVWGREGVKAVWDRMRACGGFEEQLADGKPLPTMEGADVPPPNTPPERIISVLLLHHAPSHCGAMLKVHGGTFAALGKFCSTHDIDLILCGHTHATTQRPLAVRPGFTGEGHCYELCCGSTLQQRTWTGKAVLTAGRLRTELVELILGRSGSTADQVAAGSNSRPFQNEFLVHHLELRPNRELWWRSDLWGYRPAGFDCVEPRWYECFMRTLPERSM